MIAKGLGYGWVMLLVICSAAFCQFQEAIWIKGGINPGNNILPAALSYSRDGEHVILNAGGRLKYWHAGSGNLVKIVEVGFPIVAFSSDSQSVSVREGSAFRILVTASWDLLHSFPAVPSAFQFSPDLGLILTYADSTVKLWEVATGNLLRSFTSPGATVYSACFSPNGQFVLAQGSDNVMRLWEIAGGTAVWASATSGGWLSPAFSPDGRYLAAISRGEKRIKLLQVSNAVLVRDFAEIANLKGALSFAANGNFLMAFAPYDENAFGDRGDRIGIWEVANGNLFCLIEGQNTNERFSLAALSPAGDQVVAVNENHTMKLWRPATGNAIKTITPHPHSVNAVGFTPDGRYLASTASVWNEPIKLWDVATGDLVRTFAASLNSYDSFAFSPLGRFIAGRKYNSLTLWEVTSGLYLKEMTVPLGEVGNLLAFSPDEQLLAAEVNGMIKLWGIHTDNVIVRTLAGHLNGVLAFSFSADGSQLISFGGDKRIKTWEVASGGLLNEIEVPDGAAVAAALSSDHRYLALLDDQGGIGDESGYTLIRVYKVSSGDPFRLFHAPPVGQISFSRDGEYLVGPLSDGTIRVWKVETGAEEDYKEAYPAGTATFAISPDSKHLAAGMSDGSLIFWRTRGMSSKVTANEPVRLSELTLEQNHPNPFNPSTAISFSLPRAGFVTLKIYNLLGEEIATLTNEQCAAGEHRVQWQAQDLPSGVYVYRLQAQGFSQSRKLVLLR